MEALRKTISEINKAIMERIYIFERIKNMNYFYDDPTSR
jgi:hypothetical protein